MKKVNNLVTVCLGFVLMSSSCNPVDPDDKRFDAGPILFVSDKSGTSQLYSMNEDGFDVKQLTDDPNFPIYDAKWSPDGTKIVYRSRDNRVSPPQRGYALYIMNNDGDGRYKLTNPPLASFSYPDDSNPVWSPDGTKIVFQRLIPPEAAGIYDIFIINSDGTNETRITATNDTLERVFSWWDDGDGSKWLISYFDYTREDSTGAADGKFQIAIMDLSGHYIEQLSSYESNDDGPYLSQLDSRIIFVSLIGSKWLLHLMNSDGTGRQQISKSFHRFETPVDWSPNGQSILYNGEDDQLMPFENPPRFIEILDLAGDSVKVITPFDYKSANFYATSWKR